MSNTDSFIDEVTEEVRRDRLFRLFRRYGWIALVVVLAVVGGAAWNEYSKARDWAEAQATGDALRAALGAADPAARAEALAGIAVADGAAAALADFLRADNLIAAGEDPAAAELLAAIAARQDVPPVYRSLAELKSAILSAGTMAPAERLAVLDRLAQPGAPFRAIALEQKALAHLEAGERDAAVAALRAILDSPQATPGLRQRATQMMVTLGEDPRAT